MKHNQRDYFARKTSVDVVSIFLDEVSKYPHLEFEEERILVDKARVDESAKEELLKHNLWVVNSVAKKFSRQKVNMSYIDLICEGNYGLLKAINQIEYFKGESKFSTYVFFCAKNKILSALRKEKRQREKFVSLEDLASNEDAIRELVGKIDSPDKTAEKNEKTMFLEYALNMLSERDKSVLKMHFYEGKTYLEIAELVGLKSKSSISRIINEDIEKIREFMQAA